MLEAQPCELLLETQKVLWHLMSKLHGRQLEVGRSNRWQLKPSEMPAVISEDLFDDFIPESQRKKTLGRTFEPSVVLDQDGDALRGRLIFFSDAARCRACHHTDDAALSVGPTLKDISKKYQFTNPRCCNTFCSRR
jgi:hypothetical protein